MEIKVRAWDTQLKIFSYCGFGMKTFALFVKRVNCDRYIKTLYTGRKTKKGKEIYAGDIFDIYCGDPFVNPSTITWSEENCGFYVGIAYDSDYDMCMNECIERGFPMIGNIFENKELFYKGVK